MPDISQFVTNMDKPVFGLWNLPPECYSYLFARYSRSKKGLRETLQLILDEIEDYAGGVAFTSGVRMERASAKAAEFAEKYIKGYGHASPAENAVLHFGFEGISDQLHTKLCAFRETSPQVQSTRYQRIDALPNSLSHGIEDPALRQALVMHLHRLMAFYDEWMAKSLDYYEQKLPPKPEQSRSGRNAELLSASCDALRGLLPVCALTRMGVTANARSWENVIARLQCDPLPESRMVAGLLEEEGRKMAPTLLKYVEPTPFQTRYYGTKLNTIPFHVMHEPGMEIYETLSNLSVQVFEMPSQNQAISRLAAAIHSEVTGSDFLRSAAYFNRRLPEALDVIAAIRVGPHEPLPRAFEVLRFGVQFCTAYGEFRDLQRHRKSDALKTTLMPYNGFSLSDAAQEMGVAEAFFPLFEASAELYERIYRETGNREIAARALSFATVVVYNRFMTLRHMFHVIRQRSSRQGHPDYRKVAQGLYLFMITEYPFMKGLLQCDLENYLTARGGNIATA